MTGDAAANVWDSLDRRALAAYVDEFRRAARATRDPRGDASDPVVTSESVRWRRIAATHAHRRLPADRYSDAATPGLQDSAPRSGQLALHARLEGADTDAWEHPSLAQIWFRWADYIVPRRDLGLFTVGTLPRDKQQADAIEALADIVLATVEAEGGDSRNVRRRLSDLPIRASSATGRVLIRWDARTVELVPTQEPPRVDREDARCDLARRFLHCYGPATPSLLSKFGAIARHDAEETWRAIGSELVPVAFGGRRRWMLASDMDALDAALPPEGVRFLPPDDPVLYMGDTEGPRPPKLRVEPSAGITSRLVNSLTGRLLVDGQIVGAWGRVRGDVTIDVWRDLRHRVREVEAEAATVAAAVGHDLRLRWVERPV